MLRFKENFLFSKIRARVVLFISMVVTSLPIVFIYSRWFVWEDLSCSINLFPISALISLPYVTLGILVCHLYCQTHLFGLKLLLDKNIAWIFWLCNFESVFIFLLTCYKLCGFQVFLQVPSLKIEFFFSSFLFDHSISTVKERNRIWDSIVNLWIKMSAAATMAMPREASNYDEISMQQSMLFADSLKVDSKFWSWIIFSGSCDHC